MNSTSPAHSSISTTAIVGGGSSGNAAPDDFHFPSDLISIQDRKDEAMRGSIEIDQWRVQHIMVKFVYSTHYALKSDLMAELDKEVKSLEEDNWMFEGPRSRIHLITKSSGFLHKQPELATDRNVAPPK